MRGVRLLGPASLGLAVAFLSPASSSGAEPFRIESEIPTTSIASYARYMEDPESQLTLEDVRSAELEGRFLPLPPAGLNVGHSRSTWWVRISLENVQDREAELVIQSGTSRVDEIQAHILWPDGSRELRELGDRIRPAARPLPTRLPMVELTLPARSSVELVYRVRSESAIRLPMSIASRQRHLLDATIADYTEAALHGAIIGLLVLNLFFFFSLREMSFLWYSLSSGLLILYMLGSWGYGYFLLPGLLPIWESGRLLVVGSLHVVAMILFARSYLRTSGWLDRALKLEAGLIATSA